MGSSRELTSAREDMHRIRERSSWMKLSGYVVCILFFLCASAPTAHAAIYWADGQTIGRVNLDGSYPERNFISRYELQNLSLVCGVAVDASHIYWADRGRDAIGRANLDGSSPNYSFIVGASEPCGVAVDAAHVYWANGKGGIGRANLDGTDPDQRFVDEAPGLCGVAVSGSSIYWGNWSTDSVGRADLNGEGVSPEFLEAADGACGITLDTSHIYWGTFAKTIGRANLDGTNPDPSFVSGLDRPCGVAVDGSHLFWTEESIGNGLVGSANLDGMAVNRSVVTGLRGPCGVAVDSVSYVPKVPPEPRASRLSLGSIRHSRHGGVAFVAVGLPEGGHLEVGGTRGVSWRILPENTTGPNFAPGRKWLKIWPDDKIPKGRRLRREIQQTGRARVLLKFRLIAEGGIPTLKSKRLALVGNSRHRTGTTGKPQGGESPAPRRSGNLGRPSSGTGDQGGAYVVN